MNNVLLAGATGYLGKYIAKELKSQGYFTSVIVRNKKRFEDLSIKVDNINIAEVTKPNEMKNCFSNIDVVISTVGITRQNDKLTYMDVDYQANKNLLELAKANKVKKFIYVSVLKGDELRHIEICKAKEKFVDELKASGMDYCIIRPSGFFSDMTEFYNMAKKGKIYLFGNGQYKSNPIHGADLAEVCVKAINTTNKVTEVGGPEILTQEEIAQIAFDALGTKSKIVFIPDWIRKVSLKLGKLFLNKYKFGPFQFFMNVMAMDLTAEQHGENNLYNYYKSLNK